MFDDLSSFSPLHYKISKGHKKIILQQTPIRDTPTQSHISKSISKPASFFVRGLCYHINLNSLVTLTIRLDERDKYPPYSVRISSNNKACLRYKILTSPSEGENAKIRVTAIETVSSERYAIITDNNGQELVNEHTGCLLEGSIDIPNNISDIGLHIYTPYGFSVDLGNDPAVDLCKFLLFQVMYCM